MTTKPFNPEVHPAADADLDSQFELLRVRHCGPEVLLGFLNAIEEAKRKIRDNPETWSRVAGSPTIRKVQIRRFRMTVFYAIRKNKAPLILEFAGPGLIPRWADRL